MRFNGSLYRLVFSVSPKEKRKAETEDGGREPNISLADLLHRRPSRPLRVLSARVSSIRHSLFFFISLSLSLVK